MSYSKEIFSGGSTRSIPNVRSALRVPAGAVAPALMDGLALLHNVLQAPFLKGHRGDYRGDSRARFRRVLLVDLVVPVNDCMSLVGIMWECDM